MSIKGGKYNQRSGEYIPCITCGKQVYFCPSQLPRLRVFCKSHKINRAFSFNCLMCGKRVLTQPAQMVYRNRKNCSKACYHAMRHIQALERRKTYTKHQLDRLARYSPEAQQWRKAVFERDNYTCQICGIRGSYLEADHIKPFAFFPELRFELYNGRTLCRSCHDKTKVGYKKMRELYEKDTIET